MLVEKEFKKVLSDLQKGEFSQVSTTEGDISIHLYDNTSKLALTAVVYEGGNYIPQGVRWASLHKPTFELPADFKTFLQIYEEEFCVRLHYLGPMDTFHQNSFKDLLDEFSELVGQWRLYLDENDRNDLVHVRR